MKGILPVPAQKQQENILKGNPIIQLFAPCRVSDGIYSPTEVEMAEFQKKGRNSQKTISFFIPASGSGSRMFQFLFSYLDHPNEENTAMVEHFFNSMDKFAFYTFLPNEMQKQINAGDYDTKEIVMFLLNVSGLQLAEKPKGLVPFHRLGQFALNPIQEQILQGENILSTIEQIHFTIQQKHENEINENILNLRKFSGPGKKIGFSYQESNTDAFAFNSDGTIAMDQEDELIKRPAGHGALLLNLNRIQEDVILIKNIDNIQHWDHHEVSERYWQILLGVLDDVQATIQSLIIAFDLTKFEELNQKYQLIQENDLKNWSQLEIIEKLKTPIRVCGMVRNIGQPGGGPYWVKEGEKLSKQIVEKAQISLDQQSLMIKSTHFNPVMIALGTKDYQGNQFDLENFVDESKYFIVHKEHLGKKISYCELPGLWNGSMSKWNTIFVEVPSEIFSPVKTILDLLQPLHQPKK